jgi:hypothetical protein
MRITGESPYLPLGQLVPINNGPINKGEFTDVCSLFPGSNFPIVVNPTHHDFFIRNFRSNSKILLNWYKDICYTIGYLFWV